MTNGTENLSLNVDDQPEGPRGLFDANGHLRFDLLSSGMFIMRFAPGNTALTYTWIPDDPAAKIKRARVEIPPFVGGPADEGDFFNCLLQETPAAADRDAVVEASLLSVLKCAPKLLA
jgi:hypothetical protein